MKRVLIYLCLSMFICGSVPVSVEAVPKRCSTCARDARGRILRSAAVRRAFVAAYPCPADPWERVGRDRMRRCAGFEVDHFRALSCGGRDHVGNLQWLPVAEHKFKSRQDYYCRQ